MSYTPLVTDGSGPSTVSTGTQSFTGAKTFSGGVQGPGTVPLGAIMPVVNASPITGGGYSIPPSGTVDTSGWQLCDGSVIPSGNTLTGNTPNLSDGRYLRGSTVSGTTGGSNTVTISSANLPVHSHAIDHDHASTTSGNDSGHTHTIGGSSAGPSTNTSDGPSTNTSDGPSTNTTGNDAPDHSHSIPVFSNVGSYSIADSFTGGSHNGPYTGYYHPFNERCFCKAYSHHGKSYAHHGKSYAHHGKSYAWDASKYRSDIWPYASYRFA